MTRNGVLDRKEVLLSEVCDVRYGLGQPPEADPAGVPMVRATDIKRGRIVPESALRVRRDAIPATRNPYLNVGDIIVVRSGAYTGDVAMYDGRWEAAVAGYDLVLSPNTALAEPEFLLFQFLGEQVQRYFRSKRDRSAQPHLNADQVKDAAVVLPPLPEQRAIARALRAVQEAKEARRREAALERERKAALMEYLFSHGTRGGGTRETQYGNAPKRWKELPLQQCAYVQTGAAMGRDFGDSPTVSLPYLRVANVQNGYLDLMEMKKITIRESEISRYSLQTGDVVVTEGGDFDKLGRGFVWRGEIPKCVHQNHVFAVRADTKVLMPEFLAYLVQCQYGRAYFLSVAHKTTNLACINSAKLKALPVLLPGLDEQREVVAALDAGDAKLAALDREATLLDELFRATLEELMTGRLSAQALVE